MSHVTHMNESEGPAVVVKNRTTQGDAGEALLDCYFAGCRDSQG